MTRRDLSDERIAHVIRHVGRAFQTSLERKLAEHGVNFGFWAYLRVLWDSDGLSQRDLSDQVGLTGPTTHSVVQRMEAAGLIERRSVAEGRSRRVVFLTERGRALRRTLEPLAESLNAKAVAGLSEADIETLRDWLLRIDRNLGGD